MLKYTYIKFVSFVLVSFFNRNVWYRTYWNPDGSAFYCIQMYFRDLWNLHYNAKSIYCFSFPLIPKTKCTICVCLYKWRKYDFNGFPFRPIILNHSNSKILGFRDQREHIQISRKLVNHNSHASPLPMHEWRWSAQNTDRESRPLDIDS